MKLLSRADSNRVLAKVIRPSQVRVAMKVSLRITREKEKVLWITIMTSNMMVNDHMINQMALESFTTRIFKYMKVSGNKAIFSKELDTTITNVHTKALSRIINDMVKVY